MSVGLGRCVDVFNTFSGCAACCVHAYPPACRVQVPTYIVARVLSIAGARSAEGVRTAPGGRLWGGVIRYVAFSFQGARSPCAIQSRTTRNKIGPLLTSSAPETFVIE